MLGSGLRFCIPNESPGAAARRTTFQHKALVCHRGRCRPGIQSQGTGWRKWESGTKAWDRICSAVKYQRSRRSGALCWWAPGLQLHEATQHSKPVRTGRSHGLCSFLWPCRKTRACNHESSFLRMVWCSLTINKVLTSPSSLPTKENLPDIGGHRLEV